MKINDVDTRRVPRRSVAFKVSKTNAKRVIHRRHSSPKKKKFAKKQKKRKWGGTHAGVDQTSMIRRCFCLTIIYLVFVCHIRNGTCCNCEYLSLHSLKNVERTQNRNLCTWAHKILCKWDSFTRRDENSSGGSMGVEKWEAFWKIVQINVLLLVYIRKEFVNA